MKLVIFMGRGPKQIPEVLGQVGFYKCFEIPFLPHWNLRVQKSRVFCWMCNIPRLLSEGEVPFWLRVEIRLHYNPCLVLRRLQRHSEGCCAVGLLVCKGHGFHLEESRNWIKAWLWLELWQVNAGGLPTFHKHRHAKCHKHMVCSGSPDVLPKPHWQLGLQTSFWLVGPGPCPNSKHIVLALPVWRYQGSCASLFVSETGFPLYMNLPCRKQPHESMTCEYGFIWKHGLSCWNEIGTRRCWMWVSRIQLDCYRTRETEN